jgi:hypothetical protein
LTCSRLLLAVCRELAKSVTPCQAAVFLAACFWQRAGQHVCLLTIPVRVLPVV